MSEEKEATLKRGSEAGDGDESPAKRPCIDNGDNVEELDVSPDEIPESGDGSRSSGEPSLEKNGLKYEYLDHTADIQIHSWGETLEEAFEQAVVAMFGYQTDLECVESSQTEEITVQGEDMLSLLFHLLDEFLFLFCAEPFFVPKEVKIKEFDRENWRIVVEGKGETFDLSKHPQGTEVKAITYSNMQVHDSEGKHECYFILDI